MISYVSNDFFKAYSELSRQAQKKVRELFEKFSENPMLPGLHYEKLNSSDTHLRSLRVDRDYRAIVYMNAENAVMLYVDRHDDAYEWAMRSRFVGADTPSLSGFSRYLSLEEVKRIESDKKLEISDVKGHVFSNIRKKEWSALGVDTQIQEMIREVDSEDELYALKDAIPLQTFEILEFLMAGFTAEEINTEYLLDNEQENVTSSRGAVPIKENSEAISLLFEKPLELWRLYLHPMQVKLAKMQAAGPVSVSGKPGTGKTVLAVHRCVWLAENILSGDEKMLVTTYSRQLSAELDHYISELCPREYLSRIVIENMDAWTNKYLRRHDYPYKIVYENDMKSVFNSAIGVNHPFYSFYVDEFNRVIIPNEIRKMEDYIKVSRVGRGKKIDREHRASYWPVFEKLLAALEERKIRPFEMAVLDAAHFAEKEDPCFRCAVIDEGQDFSNGVFRFIRSLCGPERENDMFILSDTRQQIYDKRPVLAKSGINVKGRSFRLRVSYRITKETKELAGFVSGEGYHDIDAVLSDKELEISENRGEKPCIHMAENKAGEMLWLTNQLQKWKEDGIDMDSICIAARTNSILKEAEDLLDRLGFECEYLDGEKTSSKGRIKLSTMHKVKGLEFDYLILLSVNKDVIPLKWVVGQASDEAEKKACLRRERNLLYVAMTRARKQILLSGYGEISEFLRKD